MPRYQDPKKTQKGRQATQKRKQEAIKRRQAAAAGTKVVKGSKKAGKKVGPTFDQAKARPKGGLGALAKKVKAERAARKKKKKKEKPN